MNLTVSSSPHIKGNDSTRRIMRDVVLAALPALIFGIVHFGVRALLVTLSTVAAALAAEWFSNRVIFHDGRAMDGSALVTGVGVMTVSEKLALAGLLLGIVSAVRLAIHRRRIEQASQRRNDLIEQILRQAETRNLSDRERQLLEQLHGDKPA